MSCILNAHLTVNPLPCNKNVKLLFKSTVVDFCLCLKNYF